MKWEKPEMAIYMLDDEDVIRTSTLTGNEGFIEEPSIDIGDLKP